MDNAALVQVQRFDDYWERRATSSEMKEARDLLLGFIVTPVGTNKDRDERLRRAWRRKQTTPEA